MVHVPWESQPRVCGNQRERVSSGKPVALLCDLLRNIASLSLNRVIVKNYLWKLIK